MADYNYILLVPLLPLLTFLVLGLWGKKYLRNAAGIMGTTALLVSAALSFYTAWQYFFVNGQVNGVYTKIEAAHYTWLQFSPGVSIDMSIVLDPVSVMMLVVVTFISLMVHLFSIGYMKGEERFATYFSFLSLFTFSMLGLVLAGNLLQVYIFWELVGVSSFLLIGFYYSKPTAVAAAKKAFIVTRFADFGFLIGILVLGFYAETLDIRLLIERLTAPGSPQLLALTTASFLGVSLLVWGLALVFIGGAGKSALFPLHIWLPDAMEGPTPVSALIHAATMVVAGVYLVARLFPVFSLSVTAMDIVTFIGVTSAVIAAVIACTQTDIKRVLAYSTMSQIGYMMFALGVSGYGGENGEGYTASLFHLFTHAFFKSLLFLCAGVIIHYLHRNDMRDMGGLRKMMPLTHIAFLIACLAIAGIPPFAGFFSKEAILAAAWQSSPFVYGIALFTSALTAFYMFRLYFSIFWKKPMPVMEHAHAPEGGLSIKLPLVILAACALLAGFVPFGNFVTSDGAALAPHFDIGFAIAPVGLAIAAILLAAFLYKKENSRPQNIAKAMGGAYTLVKQKFYVDEAYLFITKKVLFNLVGRPAAWFDKHVVDGGMNRLAAATGTTSRLIRGLQSGKVQDYTLFFFGGAAALAFIFIYLWK